MAREICIQNSRLIKRPLGIADIIGGTSWKYGTLDDHGRIDTGKIKPDGPLVIYDTSRIGRGVQIIGIESSKEIKLALPVPSTDRDVTLLYEIAEKIADLWKSKHIIVEEDKVSISDIGKYVEYDHNMNISFLKNVRETFKCEWVDLSCATLHISITIRQLEEFASDYNSFGNYLHEKQKTDVWMPFPLIAQVQGEITPLYVVFDSGHIILPKEPQMKHIVDGKEILCQEACVIVSELFPGQKHSLLNYETFLQRVPPQKTEEFDHRHIMIKPLSINELKAIFSEKI